MSTTINIGRAERPAAADDPCSGRVEAAPSRPPLWILIGNNPVLDLQSLWDIADDTGDPALALRFLADFFGLQQGRLSRVLAALADEEPSASVDAVLSLQTASAMAGATEIAKRCAIILPLVVARNFVRARAQTAALQRDLEVLTAASPMLLEQAEARLRARRPLPTLRPV